MRVIVVEDSALLRQGLVNLLEGAGVTVVGQTDQVGAALVLVDRERPDVVLLDIRLPPTFTDEGLRAAREVQARQPDVGVLLLSQYVMVGSAVRALARHGAGLGYLLKDRVADIDELVGAIKRVAAGESVLDPLVVANLLGRPRPRGALDELTEREREVLALIAQGRSNEAVGRQLRVGQKTVETHIRNIFLKLGLELSLTDHRRVLAVLTYLQADDPRA